MDQDEGRLQQLFKRMASHNRMVASYADETDRAAGILAASHFECVLEEALRTVMVKDDSVEELFSPQGCTATFFWKTQLAFALGLLAPGEARDVGLIRRIRNYFAHHPEAISFNDSPVKDWCSELLPWEGCLKEDIEPRSRFLMAIALRSLLLVRRSQAGRRPNVPEDDSTPPP